MDSKLKKVIGFNIPLLIWFFLDMTGFKVGGNLLVSQSYKEDGIFFVLYLIVLLAFVCLKGKWKVALPIWLTMWFLTQMYSHWYFTIFGPWDKKQYFADTIKLFPQTERYVADLYHIVLHILILVALVSSIRYFKRTDNRK